MFRHVRCLTSYVIYFRIEFVGCWLKEKNSNYRTNVKKLKASFKWAEFFRQTSRKLNKIREFFIEILWDKYRSCQLKSYLTSWPMCEELWVWKMNLIRFKSFFFEWLTIIFIVVEYFYWKVSQQVLNHRFLSKECWPTAAQWEPLEEIETNWSGLMFAAYRFFRVR